MPWSAHSGNRVRLRVPAPQPLQKRLPVGFSCPQPAQVMLRPLLPRRAPGVEAGRAKAVAAAFPRYTSSRYIRSGVAIQSFTSPAVARFFVEGRPPRGVGWASLARVVTRKLDMLDYAQLLTDLASPPGNRLEALKGHLAGRYSIRINDQWRVVFRWTNAGPADVDVCNYHRGSR
jgi:toxin HigB-1